jgi:hypothetical protein
MDWINRTLDSKLLPFSDVTTTRWPACARDTGPAATSDREHLTIADRFFATPIGKNISTGVETTKTNSRWKSPKSSGYLGEPPAVDANAAGDKHE